MQPGTVSGVFLPITKGNEVPLREELCKQIEMSQTREITQMKTILQRMDK